MFEDAPEGAERIFPEISAGGNLCVMVGKYFKYAGYPNVQRPWYSLRASFCNDVLASGVDLKDYQSICRHSLRVALESYQKFHSGRLASSAKALSKCDFMSRRLPQPESDKKTDVRTRKNKDTEV